MREITVFLGMLIATTVILSWSDERPDEYEDPEVMSQPLSSLSICDKVDCAGSVLLLVTEREDVDQCAGLMKEWRINRGPLPPLVVVYVPGDVPDALKRLFAVQRITATFLSAAEAGIPEDMAREGLYIARDGMVQLRVPPFATDLVERYFSS